MYEQIKKEFEERFRRPCEYIFTAPGRTELAGNHTDHQRGRVIAAAVNMEIAAAVARNSEGVIRIYSDDRPLCMISLDSLEVRPEEKNTSEALLRGMAAGFAADGVAPSGFDARMVSQVPAGSGLSSSAAFEIMIGTVFNHLAAPEGELPLDPVRIAQIGQMAENRYFGKGSGLMDQMACSVGGIIGIDFRDPAKPLIETVDMNFDDFGYKLCIIDTGASHDDLSDEYTAVPDEMKSVAAYFGKDVLREVDRSDFDRAIRELRRRCGDRAVLRAMHFFDENERVVKQLDALRNGDISRFLAYVSESGRSSWTLLQNIVPPGRKENQEVALALAVAARLLGGQGAVRVHGGGFAGTIQAFVPLAMVRDFTAGMEAVLGDGCCHVMSIRSCGGIRVE
ncbi:MAG: galactokinase [Lachnospiraceae bacterium]|nr:galactokinase [Lachnospiraceae bacterium]